jgi:hypothetical protein
VSHRIRLHGFWTTSDLGHGRVRHARRFGRPRALDPNESAWIVCDCSPGPGVVSLNGEPLGESSALRPFAFDVTARLQLRNELWIDGERGEVALEIRGDSSPA